MLLYNCRKWFSSLKVPIDAIKRLREETSAPMGECKKALEESECNHEKALLWLRQKGMTSAEKRADKQTREGVIASFVTSCRRKAVMLEVNCETDFVAKNDLFLRFVEGVGVKLLEMEELVEIQGQDAQKSKQEFTELFSSIEPANIFPEDSSTQNLNQQMKLVISRLQENIRIRRAITLHSDYSRYGTYVHRPYTEGIGLQASVVELSVDPEPETQEAAQIVDEFADDIACQILGSPPKYLNFEEIPEAEIEAETEKAREAMAQTLARAPEHTHEKIISGKMLSTYYSQVLLGCMPYLLSNEGAQVSEIWNQAEKNSGCNIGVTRSFTWQCK